ncbi:hypothetical protein LIER_06433 [Lithospermum erythrorhizon]|uniref:Uncharacterized protein n=1 Tax=Lithospermum erythrorhizon TaxID=34254 RepID=A0AAV3P4K3_LITER
MEEPNPENMKPVQQEHSGTSGGMNMHVPPTESNTGKNPNSATDFVESTETLINPTGGDNEGVNIDSPPLEGENVEGDKKGCDFGKMVGDGEGITPSVKDTSGEMRYKLARTHSSIEPTMVEVLAGLRNARLVAEKIEKKKIKKGKGKAKRSSDDHTSGGVSKKRKGVVIFEPKSVIRGDKYVVDDVVESDEEGVVKAHRERSKEKRKINENRNMINNMRIIKDVDDVPIDGVNFCSEEHDAGWKYVCARNILSERFLSEVTYNNQTYIDILQDAGLLGILSEIEPHWSQLVREFVCNVSDEIAYPTSSIFHKNEGITGATLKLGDIIGELIGKTLLTWPTKGKLSFQNWGQAEANWIPKLDL